MSPEPIFVDTNVLVYVRDSSEPEKQPRALSWIDGLWRSKRGRLSAQLLNEHHVTVTRKLSPGLAVELAREDVRGLLTWEPLATRLRVINPFLHEPEAILAGADLP